MSEDELERTVLRRVRWDRRSFIKKAIVGTVFVAPAVASFDMFALSMTASGQTCTTANGTSGTGGTGTTGGAGGTRKKSSGNDGACGGDPGGGTGGAGGTTLSDRELKTAINPISWA